MTTDNHPDQAFIILEAPPPPAPQPPPSLSISVTMPRVLATVQRDLVSSGVTTGGTAARVDHTGLGLDWQIGTKLLLDLHMVDEINGRLSNALSITETLPEDQWTTRLLPRLRGQDGDATTYEQYRELRARLVAEGWARGRYP